jgi:drug/metabolite transporter (DMT)-like permease
MSSGSGGGGDGQNYGRGIALMMLSIGFYSGMIAAIKHVAADYSVFQILFFRNLFFLPLIIPIVAASGGFAALRSERPGLHLLRNTASVTAHLCIFFALGVLALADVSAIQFTSPLIVTALAALVLRDTVGWRRWLAVFVGFAGVLVMVPPTGEVEPAALIVLLATLCYGVMVITTRMLGRTDTVGAIAFYQAMAGILVGTIALPWVWLTPGWGDLLVLALVGALGGCAQLGLVAALKAAPPPVLAPFDYTIMLWAVGFDVLLWDTVPSLRTLVGAAVIASAGLYIAQRESGVFQLLRDAIRPRR